MGIADSTARPNKVMREGSTIWRFSRRTGAAGCRKTRRRAARLYRLAADVGFRRRAGRPRSAGRFPIRGTRRANGRRSPRDWARSYGPVFRRENNCSSDGRLWNAALGNGSFGCGVAGARRLGGCCRPPVWMPGISRSETCLCRRLRRTAGEAGRSGSRPACGQSEEAGLECLAAEAGCRRATCQVCVWDSAGRPYSWTETIRPPDSTRLCRADFRTGAGQPALTLTGFFAPLD